MFPLLLALILQSAIFFSHNYSSAPGTGGGGPAAYVSGSSCLTPFSGSLVTTVTCTVANVPAGASVLLAVSEYDDTGVPSATDSAGGTVTRLASQTFGGGGTNGQISGFLLNGATPGSHTLTVTWPTSVNYWTVNADTYTGVLVPSPIDGTVQTFTGTSTPTLTCASVTATGAGELVWAAASVQSQSLDSAGAGYTLRTQIVDAVTTGAGTYTPTFNTSGADFGGCVSVALKRS